MYRPVCMLDEKVQISNESKKTSNQSHLTRRSNNNNKKKHGNNKNVREKKFHCQQYHHQCLVTSVKCVRPNTVNMGFRLHGKSVISCEGEGTQDEPDPGGGDGGSGNSSGSEGDKENAKVVLSRRQKKTRARKEVDTKKMTRKVKKSDSNRFANQFKLNAGDGDLASLLRKYLLTPEQIAELGYPVESSLYPGRAIIYKSPMEGLRVPSDFFDVNAREFVPGRRTNRWIGYSERKKLSDSLESSESSNGGSKPVSSSSECSGDSDRDEKETESQSKALIQRLLGEEKRCVRCGHGFYTLDGEYLTREKCFYHWGKLRKVFAEGPVASKSQYNCCGGKRNSRGCTIGKLHVWNGIAVGVNGPLDGYVKTKPRKSRGGVYSMDCEMCYTSQGLELAKISLVGSDGRHVYDTFVKPESAVIDYNTRFSGITAKDLMKGSAAKSLAEVQTDLMGFISSDTILIGHGLENDLKALKMIHSTVIDTSVIFPHYYGLPYRRSLRSLVSSFLKRDIQSCGHDSMEDAKACMELMVWKVKKDLKTNLDQQMGYQLRGQNF